MNQSERASSIGCPIMVATRTANNSQPADQRGYGAPYFARCGRMLRHVRAGQNVLLAVKVADRLLGRL